MEKEIFIKAFKLAIRSSHLPKDQLPIMVYNDYPTVGRYKNLKITLDGQDFKIELTQDNEKTFSYSTRIVIKRKDEVVYDAFMKTGLRNKFKVKTSIHGTWINKFYDLISKAERKRK